MKIETKFFGEMSIEENEVIQFPNGIPGFEKIQKFVHLPLEQESPFAILQSIENVEVGFVIALPFVFKEDYEFDLSDEDKEELKITDPEDLIAYSIVTLKEPFNDSTINLQAPVIINHKQKVAKQLVLQNSITNPIRYPIKGGIS